MPEAWQHQHKELIWNDHWKKNRKPSGENSAEAHQMSFLHIGTGNFFDHTIQTAM